MKNCFACNAECEDSAVICLTCGSIADQPIVQTDPVSREKAVVTNIGRNDFEALSFKMQFADKAYGRMEFLRGTLKIWGLTILVGLPTMIMMASNIDLLIVLGFVLLFAYAVWVFLKQLDLNLGRMQDFGCKSGFFKFLLIITMMFVPIAGFIVALCVLFAPRNQFAQ